MPRIDKENPEDTTDLVAIRVDDIIIKLLEDSRSFTKARSKEITQYILDEYNVSIRTAQRYMSAAKKEIRKLSKKNVDAAYTKAMRDREYFIMTYKKGNPSFAFKVIKDRDKIAGLYSENINLSGQVDNRITIVDDVHE